MAQQETIDPLNNPFATPLIPSLRFLEYQRERGSRGGMRGEKCRHDGNMKNSNNKKDQKKIKENK